MLSVFTLRLAAGMVACLLLLSPKQINPRYFRTHFLTALGLGVVAFLFLPPHSSWWVKGLLIAAAAAAFLGSVTFALENAPGSVALIVLDAELFLGSLLALGLTDAPPALGAWALVGDVTSALLLGTAMSAMLMGHLYLIAPTMSLTPLFRLLGAAGVALLLRLTADGAALWWTETHSFGKVDIDTLLWLPVRWLVGFAGPLVLGWMAWQAARIRSTQSATGILYVVVILCFLGELTGLLLRGGGITL
jgi:hypothetical protein